MAERRILAEEDDEDSDSEEVEEDERTEELRQREDLTRRLKEGSRS